MHKINVNGRQVKEEGIASQNREGARGRMREPVSSQKKGEKRREKRTFVLVWQQNQRMGIK
eukprot:scaffold67651_cov40-Attheya_sp.AAC.1